MHETRDTPNIVNLERVVLRFLCGEELDDASRANARENLAVYAWHDEEHRVVFEALAGVRNADLVPLKAQLAQHATRKGFPDVEWERYLPSAETKIDSVDRQDFKRAIEALLSAQIEDR
jgi:hypothetical protein